MFGYSSEKPFHGVCKPTKLLFGCESGQKKTDIEECWIETIGGHSERRGADHPHLMFICWLESR